MVVMESDGPSPHSPSLRLGHTAHQPSRGHHAHSLLGPSIHDPRTQLVLEPTHPVRAAPPGVVNWIGRPLNKQPVALFGSWSHVPIKDKVQYPQCEDCESRGASQNFFVSIFCESRETGNSYELSEMLKTIEENGTYTAEGQKIDNRILLISPTSFSLSNNCFKCLEGLNWEKDVMDDYDEDVFKHKINDIKKDQDEAKEYQEYCRC